jgi:proteasome lid subunit RPN8/RPN11
MILVVRQELLARIRSHGEQAYPEEGAGFLLGADGESRIVQDILPLQNASAEGTRRNRYLIDPNDYMRAELAAEARQMDVIGVFHSHPDHPDRPSEYDRDWAQPRFSYLITSIESGEAVGSRSWRLADDRARFTEEEIEIQ